MSAPANYPPIFHHGVEHTFALGAVVIGETNKPCQARFAISSDVLAELPGCRAVKNRLSNVPHLRCASVAAAVVVAVTSRVST